MYLRAGYRPATRHQGGTAPNPYRSAWPSLMSVALSGEITAIATAVLALFAIITAVLAYRALSKQAEDIHVIEQQAADQSKVLEL